MSSDCDDDRLLIDDHNDISVNEGETGNKATTEKDAANEVGDVSREEGELVDEEMEQNDGDPNAVKTKSENPKIEKRPPTPKEDGPTQKKMRVKSTPSPLPPPPIPPILKHDKSTCVQTRAIQNEADDSPFELEPGSSFTVQMTVVCRLENANTLYVTTKWKDQELSGVLTDGVPPGFQNLMKKSVLRSQNGTNYANSGEGDKSGNQSTPSKKRMGRSFQTDVRRRSARPQAENNNGNEEGDEETETNDSRPLPTNTSVAMTEIGEDKKLHECPYDDCFYQFERGVEMDYHINIFHKVKAVMRESICCQTDISALRRRDTSTETDPVPDELTDLQKDSMKQLFMAGTSGAKTEVKEEPGKRTGSPFSDISEPDESMSKPNATDCRSEAVKQEKIEPTHSNGVATVTPLPGNPLLEGQVHPSVNPMMGGNLNVLQPNGIFTSSLSSSSHFQSPRLSQHEHKIHQLKQEDASGSNTNLAPKPLSSPAQPRPHFSLPMAGPHSNHPLMQTSLTPQAAMQMFQLSMARGYPNSMGTACTPDQLAQFAAFQAANLPGSFGNIYPK